MNALALAALMLVQHQPSIAPLGTCQLASGAVIPDCRIAYRTFGRLNAARSNAILIPTWLLGRSEQWIDLLGADKFVDTTRFYAIIVDAFANGNSSSPSNTPAAGRDAFKDLTIGDMVVAQHRFVTEQLKLPRLHAVMGISMGGMQAFEWAVRYPDFMDVVIPIAGSPRVASFDVLEWTIHQTIIANGRRAGISDDTVWTAVQQLIYAFLRTPAAVAVEAVDSVAAAVRAGAATLGLRWSIDDYFAQLHAVLHHDVSAPFGGDMTRAAARVRARMLVIYSWDDHMVTAGPAVDFARLVKADTLAVPSACGHLAAMCEEARVGAVVREFLGR
jgi:homoserine O-acetyltransferase